MDRPVRVAVLGCGHWGRNLVRTFHALGSLEAISDADPARAAQFSKEYGVPALSPDAVFGSPDVDGVVIAAPAHLHADLTLRALTAGKHVYVEKPLALTVADGEAMIGAADAAGRVLMVGHLLQYHPAFLTLREMVRKGALGAVRYVYSNRLSIGILRAEENVFWSFAPHDVSMILALAGESPEAVRADGAAFLQPGVEDFYTLNLKFPSGARGHIFASWLHPTKEQRLVVVGEAAMAVFDDREPWPSKLVLYRHGVEGLAERSPRVTRADAEPVAIAETEPLRLECAHFLECVASGSPPRTDGREALAVLKVLRAGDRSIERGTWVSPEDRGAATAVRP